jgi:hypothetical protein
MAGHMMGSLDQTIPRNAWMLAALLALIVVAPQIPLERSWFVVELIFDLILLAGVYSVGPARHRWPFLMLTAITLATRWGELLSGVRGLDVTALGLTVVWLSYAVSIIIVHLFRQRDVTVDTILGAIVTYLLAATAFAMVFQIIEIRNPGSFSGLPDGVYGDPTELGAVMLFYSFVCVTTMGYGDIVPVSELARPISVLAGVFGQLYLAVMIARLVGLHVATDRDLRE